MISDLTAKDSRPLSVPLSAKSLVMLRLPNNPGDLALSAPPPSYLILYNIMKPRNVGYLLRTAAACGASEVIVVGRRNMYTDRTRGTAGQLPRRHFFKLPQAFEYLRSIGTTICGVEIADTAAPVQTHPFRGPTAFFFGNEITGLTPEQMGMCDQLVYIPQFGAAHSLNVNVSAGIVLHHFAVWAGMEESRRQGSKFVVEDPRPASMMEK